MSLDLKHMNGREKATYQKYQEMIIGILQRNERWEYRECHYSWDYSRYYDEWKKMEPTIEFARNREFRRVENDNIVEYIESIS